MSHSRNCTNNSLKFCEYLDNLKKYINNKEGEKYKKIIIILDGASIHHSKQIKTKLKEIIDLVIYLPVYTPQHPPVEHYFYIFKYNLISKRRSEPINLENMIGRKELEGTGQCKLAEGGFPVETPVHCFETGF